MDSRRYLLDTPLEDAQRRRIGQHDAGGLGTDDLPQRSQIHIPVTVRGDLPYPVTTHDGGSRIGAVSRIRNQNLRTCVITPGIMVSPYHGDAGKLALGARHGCQGYRLHACDFVQDLLQLVEAGHETLAVGAWCRGMTSEKSGQHGKRVARPGIVLHGARTQRIELGVDGEVPLGKACVVPHGLELGDFRKRGRALPEKSLRNVCHGSAIGSKLRPGVPARGGMLEDQHVRIVSPPSG